MAQDYGEYLAVNVLNEQRHVNYRNLSRALKVHSNIAKQMLYEFHRKQNSKKPGSVHATYIITGTRRPTADNVDQSQQDGEDSIMQSSPPLPSSSMPRHNDDEEETTPIKSAMLVKEEHLEPAKLLFNSVTGMHIYSLQANGLGDMQILTECNRKVAVEYTSEDPLKEWKQYGTIQNAGVRRRSGKRAAPVAPPAAKPEAVRAKLTAAAASKTSMADVQASTKSTPKNGAPQPNSVATSKTAPAKKQNVSIFKSFVKGAANPKKTESQQSSAEASPAPVKEPEDTSMTGFSEDDESDAESGLPDELEEVQAPSGKSKKDRKAELEAMMDQEDEAMEDADTPAAEDENHDTGALDTADSQEPEQPKENVTVENGRRRGRRRIMKKKTVKDEDGYLVTREEAAWESFSEEEPAPKKAKIQASSTNKPVVKKGAKPGQGNIMSFFGKK